MSSQIAPNGLPLRNHDATCIVTTSARYGDTCYPFISMDEAHNFADEERAIGCHNVHVWNLGDWLSIHSVDDAYLTETIDAE